MPLTLRQPWHARPNPRPQRLILSLLVRDEADIIEAQLRFHLQAGVDFIVATDNGSTDGTVEILEQYARQGALHLIHEAGQDYAQAHWVTRMAHLAWNHFGADWLILSDADEFWTPRTGDLKRAIADATTPVLACRPVNMMPVLHSDPCVASSFADMEFAAIVAPRRAKVKRMADLIDAPLNGALPHPWIIETPKPKVMAAAHIILEVEQGNHAVKTTKRTACATCADVVLRHYPIRSYQQFERKVMNGGSAYACNRYLPPGIGWHWRRWYKLYQRGELQAEFERQVIRSSAELQHWRAAGVVAEVGQPQRC